jgi:hypothetical protein
VLHFNLAAHGHNSVAAVMPLIPFADSSASALSLPSALGSPAFTASASTALQEILSRGSFSCEFYHVLFAFSSDFKSLFMFFRANYVMAFEAWIRKTFALRWANSIAKKCKKLFFSQSQVQPRLAGQLKTVLRIPASCVLFRERLPSVGCLDFPVIYSASRNLW